MDPKYYQIGPGFGAFLATFAIALAIIVIYRSLTKHLRKVRRDAEAAQGQQAKESGPAAEDGDGGGDVVTGEPGDGQ